MAWKITLLTAGILLSLISGFFGVLGLAELITFTPIQQIFIKPAVDYEYIYYITIIILGLTLEFCKITAAAWLHNSWNNISIGLKLFATTQVIILMIFTSWGIFGYLNKGNQQSKIPLQSISIQIEQKEQEIASLKEQNSLNERNIKNLDDVIASFLQRNSATQANNVLVQQRTQRQNLQLRIDENNKVISRLEQELVPLKQQVAASETKLGYAVTVASIFNINDPQQVHTFIILLLMLAIDPLAVLLIISATSNRKHKNNININTENDIYTTDDLTKIQNEILEKLNLNNIEDIIKKHLNDLSSNNNSILTDENKKLLEQLNYVEEILNEYKNKYSNLEVEKNNYEEKYNEVKNILEELQNNKSTLETEKSIIENNFNDIINNHKNDINDLQNINKKIENENILYKNMYSEILKVYVRYIKENFIEVYNQLMKEISEETSTEILNDELIENYFKDNKELFSKLTMYIENEKNKKQKESVVKNDNKKSEWISRK